MNEWLSLWFLSSVEEKFPWVVLSLKALRNLRHWPMAMLIVDAKCNICDTAVIA